MDEIPDKYYLMWMEVGKTYLEDLLDYDIYEDIKAYKKKVQILSNSDTAFCLTE